MALTPRDQQILRAVYKHRYLSADHIKQLFFAHKSDTAVQSRLRKLWANQFLDRYYRPFSYDGTRRSTWQASTPLYTLAERGAEVIWDATTADWNKIPKTPKQNAMGFQTLQHNLAVTDLLVAVEAACRDRDDVHFVCSQRQDELQAIASKRWMHEGKAGEWIVSDGAFVLLFPATGEKLTFHIEVVRASVRGGNRTLVEKMKRCARLHHRGYFKDVYGHRQVRAVLFCTTTDARARGFRDLAAQLPNGRGLFWFGTYQQNNSEGLPISAFHPSTVLGSIWHGADSKEHSLIPPGASLPGEPPTNLPLHV
jgi:hypothetical protein